MRCGRLWGEFLHHTYKVRFPLMLHRTSHVDGSNLSTPGLVHYSSAVRLVWCKKKKKKPKSHQNHQTTHTEISKNSNINKQMSSNISLIPTQNFQTNLQSF